MNHIAVMECYLQFSCEMPRNPIDADVPPYLNETLHFYTGLNCAIIFHQANTFQNIVCRMVTIFFPDYVLYSRVSGCCSSFISPRPRSFHWLPSKRNSLERWQYNTSSSSSPVFTSTCGEHNQNGGIFQTIQHLCI